MSKVTTAAYIHLPFHEACKRKWEHGVKEYRESPDHDFNGEALEEAYQETLDLYNLLGEIETRYKINASVSKGQAYQIGQTLKAHHRRLMGQ